MGRRIDCRKRRAQLSTRPRGAGTERDRSRVARKRKTEEPRVGNLVSYYRGITGQVPARVATGWSGVIVDTNATVRTTVGVGTRAEIK